MFLRRRADACFVSLLRRALLPLILVMLAGCSAKATFQKAPVTGQFHHDPHLAWIAPNTFLFYQAPDEAPFSFTTHLRKEIVDPSAPGRGKYRWAEKTITPGTMITDGSSVPRNFWAVRGLSPWDFAQAAIIHDWLFEAHHRYLAGEKGYDDYKDITLDDAADIFAECIRVNMKLGAKRAAFIRKMEQVHPGDEGWKEVRKVFPDNPPSASELCAYHWSVSSDCIVKSAQKLWDTKQNNMQVCRVILGTRLGSEWFRARIAELLKSEERVALHVKREQLKERNREIQPAQRTIWQR
jgi:hypothetical protein